ncbi:DNA-processing protein DprA [bacterium]|nr:DNA-processing protein DprA [bacterium]
MEPIENFVLKPNTFLTGHEIWSIAEPPRCLYAHGKRSALTLLQYLPERGLAVVGTREPQERTQAFLKSEIRKLSSSSLIILSGLARGIDAVAHEAALDAGLPTIAVIAAGLTLEYPKETLSLRKRILDTGGLIISEYPIGTPARRQNFLQRNRMIAGWAKATWVVEAKQRSGSLNTARWARENNRTCITVPCFPENPLLKGNQILLDRDHALAYWGVHSLGAIWLDLAAAKK